MPPSWRAIFERVHVSSLQLAIVQTVTRLYWYRKYIHPYYYVQEAQLMLIKLRDAFRSQSRSPNMVPFDMSGMVSN